MTKKFLTKLERLNDVLWASDLKIVNDGDKVKITDGVEEISIVSPVGSAELDLVIDCGFARKS